MNFEKYQQINEQKINFGEMEDADVVSDYRNQGCGDGYRIFLRVEGGRIVDSSYTTTGCGFGLAALAIVTDLARGRTLEEARAISTDDINAGLDGFPPRRQNYPESALEAFQQALDDLDAGRGRPEDVLEQSREDALRKIADGGNWVGENIGAVNLDGKNFDGLDARGVNLSRASLRNTSWREADLTDANLRLAFLNDADLSGAKLVGADLRFAKLDGADLTGADLTGAVYNAGTRIDQKWLHLLESMREEGKLSFVRSGNVPS